MRKIKRSISSFWRNIKCIPQNILRIARWVPVLWNNFDFDYGYLLGIMKFKMSRIRKEIDKNQIVERSDEIVAQLQFCEDLIERILKDDYAKKEMEEHYLRWKDTPRCISPVRDENHFKRRDEFGIVYDLFEKQKSKDYDLLFRVMRKCIQGWWD